MESRARLWEMKVGGKRAGKREISSREGRAGSGGRGSSREWYKRAAESKPTSLHVPGDSEDLMTTIY